MLRIIYQNPINEHIHYLFGQFLFPGILLHRGNCITHAIIGSVAALQPERFEEWLSRWGSRMVLGADVRQTAGRWRVAVKGWQEEAPLSLDAILRRFAGRELREAIVTDIGRDGMLQLWPQRHGTDGFFIAKLRRTL